MHKSTKTSDKTLIYAYSIALILIWGTAYTMVGYAVVHVAPVWLVASRTCIAAIILTLYMYIRGRRFPPLTDSVWIWYGGLGFVGMTAPFYFIAQAQMQVDSGLTAILIGFMPLATIVLAHFFVKGEALSWRKSIGFIIGFSGLFILFMPDTFALELIEDWRAQSLILLGATLYAITTILAKLAPEVHASVGACMIVIGAAVWSLVWLAFSGTPQTLPPTSAILAILGIAVGSTAFAQILYLRLIQISGPTLIAKLNYLVPICALVSGIVFLDERFGWRTLMAMGVIFVGLLIARSKGKP
ncbi:MAG: EamA family transporter [Robiginitomaculum sp.]|nr:MAG: EamA family transporter [Robiginitomaculum sp.]